MKASFLTSVVDEPRLFEKMLSSLAMQTIDNFELVLVIDKPDDPRVETALFDLTKEYANNFDIVTIQNDHRRGLTFNLNHAAAAARGDVLVRIDADDMCAPNRLETIMPFFESGFHLVGNACQLINAADQAVGIYPDKQHSHRETHGKLTDLRRVVAHSGLAFSKLLFERINGYDEHFTFAQDYDFLLRAIEATSNEDFVIIEDVLTIVRLHDAAISQSTHRLEQITFQLEALIQHRARTSPQPDSTRTDIHGQALKERIMAAPQWKSVTRAQEFKARLRSEPRITQLLNFIMAPQRFFDVINQRRSLLKIANNIKGQ